MNIETTKRIIKRLNSDFLFKDAQLLASILHSENKSCMECICLLARCMINNLEYNRAHQLLSDTYNSALEAAPEVIYLLMLCCKNLGFIEEALQFVSELPYKDETNFGSMYTLSGDIYWLAGNEKAAIQHYLKAVERNPFLLRTINQLSNLGHPFTPHMLTIQSAIKYDTSSNTLTKQEKQLVREDIPKKNLSRVQSAKRAKKEPEVVEDTSETLLMPILRVINQYSIAYSLVRSYNTNEAILHWEKLSSEHYHTAWVYTQIALCHYHASNYRRARLFFQDALRLNPFQVDAMDYYSNVLWHLKDIPKLSHLSKQLLPHAADRGETWCVLGNLYSLQNSEKCLPSLKRGVELKSVCAHVLLGHEYFMRQEYPEALQMYQLATQMNPRDYKAWYGMGNVYAALEKKEEALSFYERSHSLCGMDLVESQIVKIKCELRKSVILPKGPVSKLAYLNYFPDVDTLRELEHLEGFNVSFLLSTQLSGTSKIKALLKAMSENLNQLQIKDELGMIIKNCAKLLDKMCTDNEVDLAV